jgi:hypothetical protein
MLLTREKTRCNTRTCPGVNFVLLANRAHSRSCAFPGALAAHPMSTKRSHASLLSTSLSRADDLARAYGAPRSIPPEFVIEEKEDILSRRSARGGPRRSRDAEADGGDVRGVKGNLRY